MPDDHDGILELLEESNSVEEFLEKFDDPQMKRDVTSTLENEGERYTRENGEEFTELEDISVGVGVKLYEYLHREPPEERPQEIRA